MGLLDSLKEAFRAPGVVTHDDVVNDFKRKYPLYEKVPNEELARDLSAKMQADYGYLTGFDPGAAVPAPLVPKELRSEDFYYTNPEVAKGDALASVSAFKTEYPAYKDTPDNELAADMERVYPDKFKGIGTFIQYDPKAAARDAEAAAKEPKTGLADTFTSGLSRVNESLTQIPSLVYDVAALPQNAIAKVAGKPEWQVQAPDWLQFDDSKKYWEASAQSRDFVAKRWGEKGEDLSTLVKKKDFGEIANYLAHQVVANAPQQLMILGAAASGFGTPTVVGMGVMSAADEASQNRGKVDPATNTVNAVTVGTIESAFENLGTLGLFKSWEGELAKSFGSKTAKKIMVDVGKSVAHSVLGEGNEEFLTSLAQDFTRYATGVDPNALKGAMNRAFEQGAVGAISGGVMTAPTAAASGLASAKASRLRAGYEAAVSGKTKAPGGETKAPAAETKNDPRETSPTLSEQTEVKPETLGAGTLQYVQGQLPALAEIIKNQKFPVPQAQLNVEILKAIAVAKEAALSGANPAEAQIAALQSFATGVNIGAKAQLPEKTPPSAAAASLQVPPAQMDPDLYARVYGQGRPAAEVSTEHKNAVAAALAKSEPVPPAVLKAYPELAKKEEPPAAKESPSSFYGNTVGAIKRIFGVKPPPPPQTPEFKGWFGKSKIVDQKTNLPRVVYHGTEADFTAFDPAKRELGFHFAVSPDMANARIDPAANEELADYGMKPGAFRPGARIIPAYLKIDNPIRAAHDVGDWNSVDDVREAIRATLPLTETEGAKTPEALRELLKAKGYDGIVYTNQYENTRGMKAADRQSYIVFEPNQIKSVFNPKPSADTPNLFSEDTPADGFSVIKPPEFTAPTKHEFEVAPVPNKKQAELRLFDDTLDKALLTQPRSFEVKYRKDGFLSIPNQKVNSAADLAFAFRQLKNEQQENFFLGAMKDGRIIAVEHLGFGTVHQVTVHPFETINLLDSQKADGYFVVHNHPSGEVSPSFEDRDLTNRLKGVLGRNGLQFYGHVIIDDTKFGFIDPSGLVSEMEHQDYAKVKKLPVLRKYTEWLTDKKAVTEGPHINSPGQVFEFAKGIQLGKDEAAVALLNFQNRLLNSVIVPRSALTAGNLQVLASRFRSPQMVLVQSGLGREELYKLKLDLKEAEINFMDDIALLPGNTYRSAQESGILGEKRPEYNEKANPASAVFIGYMETGLPETPHLALYNITGNHPNSGSTVTIETLNSSQIKAPEIPSFEVWKKTFVPRPAQRLRESAPEGVEQAAFRINGEVVPVGPIHDPSKIPTELWNEMDKAPEEGFVTTTGRFVTRAEARGLSRASAMHEEGEGYGDAQEPSDVNDVSFNPGDLESRKPMSSGMEGLRVEESAFPQIMREARALRAKAIAEMDPLVQYITDNGGLRPFATSELEEFQSVPLYLRKFEKGMGKPIDVMAQNAFDAGLLDEPTTTALLDRLAALPRRLPRVADFFDEATRTVTESLENIPRVEKDLKKNIEKANFPSRRSLPKLYTERAALRRGLQLQSLAAAAAHEDAITTITSIKLETAQMLEAVLPDELAKPYLSKLATVKTMTQAEALVERAEAAADAYLKSQEIAGRKEEIRERRQERAELHRLFNRQAAAAREGARGESERIAEIQKAVTDMIEKGLPLDVRGKFLNVVRNARTAQDYLIAGARIDDALRDWQKRTLLTAIKRSFQRIQAAKSIAIDYQQKVRSLLSDVLFQKPTATTKARYTELRNYVNAQAQAGKDVTVPRYVMERLKLLTARPLSELSVADLEEIHNEMNVIAELGKTKFRVRAEAERMSIERTVEDIQTVAVPLTQDILERKPIGADLPAMARLGNRVKSILNKVRLMNHSLTPMDVIFDIMDGQQNYEGPLFRALKAPVDSDYSEYLDFKDALKSEAKEKAKSLGLDRNSFEKIMVHAAAVQEDGVAKLENLGVTTEEIASNKLTPAEMEWYQFARKRMDSVFPAVRELMREVFNRDVGEVRNYFSFITDQTKRDLQDVHERMIVDVRGDQRNFTPSATKARTGTGDQKILLNAFDVYMRHMDDVAYLLKMGRTIHRLGRIVNDERFKAAVGDIGHFILKEWVDTLAKKGGSVGGLQIRALDVLRNNVGTATLALKLSTFLVQYLAINQGTSFLGTYAYKGLGNVLASSEWRKFISANMPEVRDRVGDAPDIAEFTSAEGRSKLKELAFLPIQRADYFAASAIASGAYEKFMRDHEREVDFTKPDKEAIAYAQRIVRRTQAGTASKDLPQALTRGAFTGNRSIDRMLFQFQNFALNEWSVMTHDGFGNIGEGNIAKGVLAIMGVIWAAVLETGFRMKLDDMIQATFGWDEEQKPAEAGPLNPVVSTLPNDFSRRVALSLVQKIPLMNSALSYWNYDSLPAPLLETLAKTVKGVRGFVKSQDPMGKRRNLIRAVGGAARVAGIPGTAQAEQAARYAFTDPFQKKLTDAQRKVKEKRRDLNKARFQRKIKRQEQLREAANK